MNDEWPFVTVTVVTVVFLRVSVPFIIYITIYILISYKDYKGGCTPSFFNCNNCNCNARLAFGRNKLLACSDQKG